jgi:HlyD family secretion protein
VSEQASPRPEAVTPNPDSVLRTVSKGRARPVRTWLIRLGVLLLIVASVAGFMAYRKSQQPPDAARFVTKAAFQGDLEATVSATGNLRGVDTVQIGAEVSGRVRSVAVDFNDAVEEGQVLCEIDPEQLSAQRDQSRAQLASAQAELANRKAGLNEAKQKAARAKELSAKGLLSQQELETALTAVEQAEASVQASVAQITLAGANISATESSLKKASILSPMSGVVLERTVEVGQTLNSDFSTPVLFTLSKDLKDMELVVGIDEADIGQVQPGQTATFSVDAYPNRVFTAELATIRNIATVVENVVTYEAVLTVENADRLLRPGMTAMVTIVTTSKKDILLVPNTALRFSPPDPSRGPRVPGLGRVGSRPSASADEKPKPKPNEHRVYIVDGDRPKPVFVKLGLTDGENTEVLEGDIDAGTELVTEMLETPE